MKLAGDFVFDAEVHDVWDALFDPAVLAAVMPGCEKLDKVDGSFVGEIKVKVGPIQGKFSGKVDLDEIDAPRSYRMIVDGRGTQGFVKATARVELAAEGTATRITYDADAHVGGRIASVGQRLVETAARAIVAESLTNLNDNIRIRTEALRAARREEPPAPEPDGLPAPAPVGLPAPAPVPVPVPAPDSGGPPQEPPVNVPAPEAAGPPHGPPQKPPAPTPGITYKRADASRIARSVARDVGKVLLPWIIAAVATVALIICLLTR